MADHMGLLAAFQHLDAATDELQGHYDDLLEDARKTLGEVFVASDYPESIKSEFAIGWDFPPVAADERLATLAPELYER